MKEPKTFKLCLTLAGAVSAGAYTAGVMDYLLETLELWKLAKHQNRKLGIDHPDYDHSIPMHDVEIEVLSGASAGGITATLSLLSLVNPMHRPVNSDNPERSNNLFYDCWVQMADEPGLTTLEKMLQTDDLKPDMTPMSLLNSNAIEILADKALRRPKTINYPEYISEDLDLILTTTNLRGLNFKVDFDDLNHTGASHIITSHGGFFRYKMANTTFSRGIPEKKNALYYVLDLNSDQDLEYLRDATLSTAAFPIVLRSREVSISATYIERYPNYLFGKKKGITPILPQHEKNYTFNSIDGGLINNEPYGIGLKVLKQKNPGLSNSDNYAVIMVDPFPNQDHEDIMPETENTIWNVAAGMFKALRNQVMFNQDGIMDALSLSDRTKFLIAPSKKINTGSKNIYSDHPLASAPLSGFAGFMEQKFRNHDFELGRKNCQDFLRYHFTIKIENCEKRLGSIPVTMAIDRFEVSSPARDPDGSKYFPIIPDLKLEKAFSARSKAEFGKDASLPYPESQKINMHIIQKRLQKPVRKRISALVGSIGKNIWLTAAFRLVYLKRSSVKLFTMLQHELKRAGLLE
ncbi:patatin-like phospholipase family protein [Robertkochia solimangrovi]|uniref:patatin-like phospholipase family protein n=1 Tax=Robertkochia solimangrovi TaxID=2213046 RepID=UPI0013A54299|nr:patatin-like phospholipase family protein [Robertkochia solimangrovi]